MIRACLVVSDSLWPHGLMIRACSVVSDSLWPHGLQPARLLCPWNFPGKSTGVNCHFLLQCMKVKSESEISQLCPTLSDPMHCSLPSSSMHGIFQARVLEWVAIAFSGRAHGRHPINICWMGWLLTKYLLNWWLLTKYIHIAFTQLNGFPGGSTGKEPAC